MLRLARILKVRCFSLYPQVVFFCFWKIIVIAKLTFFKTASTGSLSATVVQSFLCAGLSLKYRMTRCSLQILIALSCGPYLLSISFDHSSHVILWCLNPIIVHKRSPSCNQLIPQITCESLLIFFCSKCIGELLNENKFHLIIQEHKS